MPYRSEALLHTTGMKPTTGIEPRFLALQLYKSRPPFLHSLQPAKMGVSRILEDKLINKSKKKEGG
jgi:hypothetical protein